MLLRDGLALRIKELAEGGGVVMVPAHTIPTKNGICAGFVMGDSAEQCDPGKCEIHYIAHCETPFGKRFVVMGLLPSQAGSSKLEAKGVETAKTFDKILSTLEFKKF